MFISIRKKVKFSISSPVLMDGNPKHPPPVVPLSSYDPLVLLSLGVRHTVQYFVEMLASHRVEDIFARMAEERCSKLKIKFVLHLGGRAVGLRLWPSTLPAPAKDNYKKFSFAINGLTDLSFRNCL